MYIIYHKETTRTPHVKGKHWQRQSFATERAAKAGLTRAIRDGKLEHAKEEYAIAEITDFRDNIEKQVERINMMSGKPYMESINTPGFLSPSSEAYWSM